MCTIILPVLNSLIILNEAKSYFSPFTPHPTAHTFPSPISYLTFAIALSKFKLLDIFVSTPIPEYK